MRAMPNAIMIGSGRTNSGKTTFACMIIEKFREAGPFAIKVTTLSDDNDVCPSGKNCGVCTSLDGRYMIVEESNRDGMKDSSKLLRAGAARVFWLRTRRACLSAGIEAVLHELPAGACLVLESNSARTVVEPGVFVVTRERADSVFKPTCSEVLEYADRIVGFDDFRETLDDIRFENGSWSISRSLGNGAV
jgi:molybdopterin-guanine dinucleotide biosynthesis protein